MIFNTALSHIQKLFAASYDVSSTIRHKGEKGRQRENGLAKLLREHLPLAYGVATGEIIPYVGSESSPQCDIIIYDQLQYPLLGRNEAVQLVPLEAVYAVIEVKSILDASALADAHKKFTTILAMPRCKSTSKLKKGMRREPFFMTFGYRLGTSYDTLADYQTQIKYEYAIASLDTGVGFAIGEGKKTRHIIIKGQDNAGKYQTLAVSFFVLLESMKQIDLGSPNHWEILLDFE